VNDASAEGNRSLHYKKRDSLPKDGSQKDWLMIARDAEKYAERTNDVEAVEKERCKGKCIKKEKLLGAGNLVRNGLGENPAGEDRKDGHQRGWLIGLVVADLKEEGRNT